MFARSMFSSTCGGIRKSTRRPSNDRWTSPETSLSPTRDIRSCARTTTSSRTVGRGETSSFGDVTASKENVRQCRSRSTRTLKSDYATPHVSDRRRRSDRPPPRSPCTPVKMHVLSLRSDDDPRNFCCRRDNRTFHF